MAVNCCVVPFAIEGFAGVTAIDTTTAGPTVKVVLPVTPAELALTWEVPCVAPVARPATVIVATAGFDDTHVTELVISSVDASE